MAHFDRIVGLRDGVLAFDLPTPQVGREHLARLYAQHEDELAGAPGHAALEPNAAPQPVVMHCR
jgi:phosphonate transport system ATP-binding protein